MLVTWDGWLGRAAKLYANGHDLKGPFITPICGDFAGFPATILTSGTRAIYSSATPCARIGSCVGPEWRRISTSMKANQTALT